MVDEGATGGPELTAPARKRAAVPPRRREPAQDNAGAVRANAPHEDLLGDLQVQRLAGERAPELADAAPADGLAAHTGERAHDIAGRVPADALADHSRERAHDIADAVRALAGDGEGEGEGEGEGTLVAVDGAGGSGKTTLAAMAAELLDGATIVHGDDFYRVMPSLERERLGAEQGYRRYFDGERLRDQVLAPLRAGRAARYQSFDWATEELGDWHEISPGSTVIVEGVYSARPELAPYYDLTVYVDTSREVCLQRVRARGQDTEDWIMRWRAAEDHYIRTTRPQTRARLVIKGY